MDFSSCSEQVLFLLLSLFFLIRIILTKQLRWSTLKLNEVYGIIFKKYITSVYMNDVLHENKICEHIRKTDNINKFVNRKKYVCLCLNVLFVDNFYFFVSLSTIEHLFPLNSSERKKWCVAIYFSVFHSTKKNVCFNSNYKTNDLYWIPLSIHLTGERCVRYQCGRLCP